MKYMYNIPQTLLAHLAIPGCDTIKYNQTHAVWEFPCGLRINDEHLACSLDKSHFRALMAVHQNHHDNKHTASPWDIIEQVEDSGTNHKYTAWCSCLEPHKDNI